MNIDFFMFILFALYRREISEKNNTITHAQLTQLWYIHISNIIFVLYTYVYLSYVYTKLLNFARFLLGQNMTRVLE